MFVFLTPWPAGVTCDVGPTPARLPGTSPRKVGGFDREGRAGPQGGAQGERLQREGPGMGHGPLPQPPTSTAQQGSSEHRAGRKPLPAEDAAAPASCPPALLGLPWPVTRAPQSPASSLARWPGLWSQLCDPDKELPVSGLPGLLHPDTGNPEGRMGTGWVASAGQVGGGEAVGKGPEVQSWPQLSR